VCGACVCVCVCVCVSVNVHPYVEKGTMRWSLHTNVATL